MREESVARRYAAALFTVASNKNRAAVVRNELQAITKAVQETPELKSLLHQPLITEEKKKAALDAVFGRAFSEDTLVFLKLLVDKRRIETLPAVNEEFAQLVRVQLNIEFATAISAVPLTPQETAALEKSLEARTGKDIELKTEVDPSLMGGVLVRIGDTVYDGTVKGNLERLREHLIARK
jgi:F-type H+-transporting ATPase subunit delta